MRLAVVLLAAALTASACTSATAGRGVSIAGPPQSSSATPTPTQTQTPTVGTCPGARTPTRATVLRAAVLPHSPDHVPTNSAASGAQSIGVLVHQTYRDVDGAAAFLMGVGYRNGYQMTWSRGTPGKAGRVTEFATLYEFTSSAGACSFAAWEAHNFQLRPAAGLPGLTVKTERLASVHAWSTEFAVVKGSFVVLSGALVYADHSGAAVSRQIMTSQYARV